MRQGLIRRNVAPGAEASPVPAARLVGVSKRLGPNQALTDVSLAVGPGSVRALLGPNGAGKTTAVNLLLGLRRPDTGTVALFGADPRHPAARRRLGATPQSLYFPPTLTVGELVRFVGNHCPQPAAVGPLLDRLGLAPLEHRQSGGLSGGQRRRLAFALALAGRPRLLVLDEPTTGLDVEARHRLWKEVRRFRGDGGAVLLTTHYLEEADVLADRVTLIAGGRVVGEGSPAEMKASLGQGRVEFDTAPETVVTGLAGVTRWERTGDRVSLWTADPDSLVVMLVRGGIPFRHLSVASASLEEAVLATLGGGTHDT